MTDHHTLDSPSLSKANHKHTVTGQEPVISGVDSRIVATRHGAYRAGKLSTLLKLMNSAQRMRFQQWSVRVAVRYARKILPLYEEALAGDRRPRLAIVAAQLWLENPTVETEAAARRAGRAAEKAALEAGKKLSRIRVPKVQHAALAAKCTALAAASQNANHLLTVVSSIEAARTDMFDYKYAPDAVRRAQLRAAMVISQKRTL